MIIYDDKSDVAVERLAKVWSKCDYFPGALPASELPQWSFNLYQKQIKDNIFVVDDSGIHNEYYGVSILYTRQKRFGVAMLGWLRLLPPFSIIGWLTYKAKRMIK